MSRFARCCAVAFVSLASSLMSDLVEAQVMVEPSITVFAGEGRDPGAVSEEDEQYLGIAFHLPVERQTERGTFSLLLDVARQEGEDSTALDSDDLRFSTNGERRVSPRGTFDFGIDLSQQQQRPTSLSIVLNPTLRRRLETRNGQLRLGHTTALSERRRFEIRASHGTSRFRELDNQSGESALTLAEDRAITTGELAFGLDTNRRWSFRPSYRYSLFDFDARGRDDSHELLVGFRRQVDDRSYFEFEVGGYRFEPEIGEESDGAVGLVRFSQLFANTGWDIRLRHGLEASDPFLGVYESSDAFVTWSVLSRYFDSSVSLGLASLDPLVGSSSRQQLESFLVGASIGIALGPYFGLRIDYAYSEGLGGDIDGLDYSRVNVGLTWYPNKNQRFGSLGRLEDSPAGRSRRARSQTRGGGSDSQP